VSGPECNDGTTHGKWLSETTRPLETLSGAEFLRNFHQYWLEHGGKEAKDPLRKTFQALQQVTATGNESACAWTSKLMWHAVSVENPFSAKHKYLWREFESVIYKGREPDWEEAQEPLKMRPNDKQNVQMEISATKLKPPWKEQWQVRWVQALAPRNPKWQHWLCTHKPMPDPSRKLVAM
jgi:hypothetical protein